jgi:Fur family ferric uptake transcriptional regulator
MSAPDEAKVEPTKMSFLEQASQAIHESGGRMTAQRQIILELLAAANDHLDAEGLYQLAHERDTRVSLATVYRTLNTLAEAGLVQQRYESRDHERKIIEPVTQPADYHFTCRHCHRVIPFQSELVQQLKHDLQAEFNVQVFHACVCLDGLCPDCRVTLQGENQS